GSGKTTLLRYLVQYFSTDPIESQKLVKLLSQEEIDYLIPVFIPLRNIVQTDTLNSKDLISRIFVRFEELGFENPQIFVSEVLEKGKCLILLDGLDEVAHSQRMRFIRTIESFNQRYPQNWII